MSGREDLRDTYIHYDSYISIFFPRYYAAVSHSGYLTLTTPYLDMGGAGEVITAARSLYRGESNDNVLGVMGADFPLRHFYRYCYI